MRFGQELLSRRTASLICLALAALLQPLARAEPLFPLTVQLDWIENAQFAGLLVAKERGWYAQQGLDITIQPVNQTTLDTVGPVVRGRNVIGCADGMVLLRARRAHQPIQAFATTLQASPLGIVTLRSSHLNHIKDLAGKTIGLHAYDETAAMLVATYLPGKDLSYQVRSLMEIRNFATIESPQLGQMRLTTWRKSCALFHLDPALANQLANFSVLQAVYRKEDRP